MGQLLDVSSGDLITAQRQNDINDYIEQGTHAITTLALDAGSGDIKTTGNFTDGTNSVTAAQMKAAYDERCKPNLETKNGSDCTGSDGEKNRTLTLTNTPDYMGIIIIQGTCLIPDVDYTQSGDTITFLNKVWDSQKIVIQYFTKEVI